MILITGSGLVCYFIIVKKSLNVPVSTFTPTASSTAASANYNCTGIPENTPEAVLKQAIICIKANNIPNFVKLWPDYLQQEVKNAYSSKSEQERVDLVKGLKQAKLNYRSSDGYMVRYQYNVIVNGQEIEFLMDIKQELDGKWKLWNM